MRARRKGCHHQPPEVAFRGTAKPVVVVTDYGESAVTYHVRCWSRVETYWDARNTLTENIKYAFDKAGVTMPYNHLNIHILDK